MGVVIYVCGDVGEMVFEVCVMFVEICVVKIGKSEVEFE